MTIYVVTLTAVYDHGCFGVFTTLDAATARCRELWDVSDGHHDYRIDVLPLDTPVSGAGDIGEDQRELILADPNPDHYRRMRSRIGVPADDHIEIVTAEETPQPSQLLDKTLPIV